jgi:YegS/Rv2252/BmrU family lipid kinase
VSKRILVVINPVAGKKHKINPSELVEQEIGDKASVEYLLWESAEMDITKAVHEKINALSFDIVMAMGGDGTVNRVAQALIGRNESLLIIPMGSGNGLAHHLHVPMNLKKAIQLSLTGKTATIDTAKINNLNYFCSAGVGFDALVANKFATSGSRGFLKYLKISIIEYFTYKPKIYKINYDQNFLETKAFFITVANANQWGNNIRVAPTSHINDGMLQLVILKSFSWINLPKLIVRILSGTFHKSSEVLTFNAKSVHIERSSESKEAHFDGEPVLLDSKIEISINPSSLKVIIPEKNYGDF